MPKNVRLLRKIFQNGSPCLRMRYRRVKKKRSVWKKKKKNAKKHVQRKCLLRSIASGAIERCGRMSLEEKCCRLMKRINRRILQRNSRKPAAFLLRVKLCCRRKRRRKRADNKKALLKRPFCVCVISSRLSVARKGY